VINGKLTIGGDEPITNYQTTSGI